MRNQPLLMTIIVLLIVIAGTLLYTQKHPADETVGEKVGNTIDHVTGERK